MAAAMPCKKTTSHRQRTYNTTSPNGREVESASLGPNGSQYFSLGSFLTQCMLYSKAVIIVVVLVVLVIAVPVL